MLRRYSTPVPPLAAGRSRRGHGGCYGEDRLGCFLDRAGADGRRCDCGAPVYSTPASST
ncbi:hypothetical protein ACP70R_018636 [Stipagrostis hirtigluma subsp. patula]